jgi:glycerol-3-phosphate dehydrogenase
VRAEARDDPSDPFDVIVIGAGVVGCAVARRFALEGASICVLERASDLLCGSASKGNSAILHTGFDAPENSLELRCVRAGYREYLDVCDKLNLPVLETGAVVVAWTDEDAERLPEVARRARANGIEDVRELDPDELAEREPHLAPGVRAALLVPGEHVIDPWSTPFAYLLQAVLVGAEVRFDQRVRAAERSDEGWRLTTTTGVIDGRVVINCAGLFGDQVDRLAGIEAFDIRPRKGQFVVLDKSAGALLRTIVLPVPTDRTKGTLMAPTVFGNLLVGPTAEDVEEREAPAVDEAVLRELLEQARARLPAIADHDVTAVFAGLRPATAERDYRIDVYSDLGWITVGGIRSTGLTASLGIAGYVWERFAEVFAPAFDHQFAAVADPPWPAVPNLAEHCERDYQRPGSGRIVCHCESVTRREIEAALEGPLPARSLEALRRRTRAMLGRCQGFYCTGEIAAIVGDRFARAFDVDRGSSS